jgi:hypothetical protein
MQCARDRRATGGHRDYAPLAGSAGALHAVRTRSTGHGRAPGLCTVSRQRWGAACSAHAIDGPRAGTGTMHRQPAALGRCLQCARDRRATGGQRDASAPHLRVARTILWTGNAPGLLRAATLLAICTSPIVRTRRQSPCAPRPLSLLPLLPCVLLAAVIRADTASCF